MDELRQLLGLLFLLFSVALKATVSNINSLSFTTVTSLAARTLFSPDWRETAQPLFDIPTLSYNAILADFKQFKYTPSEYNYTLPDFNTNMVNNSQVSDNGESAFAAVESKHIISAKGEVLAKFIKKARQAVVKAVVRTWRVLVRWLLGRLRNLIYNVSDVCVKGESFFVTVGSKHSICSKGGYPAKLVNKTRKFVFNTGRRYWRVVARWLYILEFILSTFVRCLQNHTIILDAEKIYLLCEHYIPNVIYFMRNGRLRRTQRRFRHAQWGLPYALFTLDGNIFTELWCMASLLYFVGSILLSIEAVVLWEYRRFRRHAG